MSNQIGRTQFLHNSESGICEYRISAGVNSYASELARYIRCPSTIRVRVLDRFGYAPTVDECRALRDAQIARRDEYRQSWEELGEQPDDEIEFRVSSVLPKQKRVRQPWFVKTEALPAFAPVVAKRTAILPAEIVDAIAEDFKLTGADLRGSRRYKPIIRARRTAVYVLRERGHSYPNIGRRLGNRDHSTMVHAYREFLATATSDMREIAARYIGTVGA